MCGIAGLLGANWNQDDLDAMVRTQNHRGPDDRALYLNPSCSIGLGHCRLSIIDLSPAGRQPMANTSRTKWIVFNGEVYNYLELKDQLSDYTFQSRTDTEVVLAAYERWGERCLDRFIGMFAFAVWDESDQSLFLARDRFGVKPLYYHQDAEWFGFASEIKALHAAGVPRHPDPGAWATYLAHGIYDHGSETFWTGIRSLPPGTWARCKVDGPFEIHRWYEIDARVAESGEDGRPDDAVEEDLKWLLTESLALRFRSDVEVGVCLSGGLDSSLLVALMGCQDDRARNARTFTFYCGDENYDEIPWVEQLLHGRDNSSCFCLLTPEEVPELAQRMQWFQDEPFGGIPTLGMAKVHAAAADAGVTVLLDGNGLDEGWAGYDYYQHAADVDWHLGLVQGSKSPSTRADGLRPEFKGPAETLDAPRPFACSLASIQWRDIRFTKIPRMMRFADRVSMAYSRELREPFLDHRIVELGLRQPAHRKIRNGQGKWLPRIIANRLMPRGIPNAPKRPVQTPQREWLRGPLAEWADAMIESALKKHDDWFDTRAVRQAWNQYRQAGTDNSFAVWQWISLGMADAVPYPSGQLKSY